MLPLNYAKSHLVITIAGGLGKTPGRKPLMAREELLGSNHRQNLVKDAASQLDSTSTFCSIAARRSKEKTDGARSKRTKSGEEPN